MRACAACRSKRPRGELVRFVADGPRVVPDLRRRAGGRGVNVCPTADCVELAIKRRAFGRGLRCSVQVDRESLLASVRAAFVVELDRAVAGGRRSHHIEDAGERAESPSELADCRSAMSRSGAPLGGVPVVVKRAALAARVAWLASGLQRLQSQGRVL
ncbi:MAG: YlxR family protein [Myxococcota bacterium]